MQIISHRGYWLNSEEKNSVIAFQRSFKLGFGTETDVRDSHGELVISHDIPKGGELSFTKFLDLLEGNDLPLGINIKADGLADEINKIMYQRNLTNWFVFDMSTPDMVNCINKNLPVFGRLSEYEPHLPLSDRIKGIWLDSFGPEWWDCELIERWTNCDKKVCIVSPELHKRNPLPVWERLFNYRFSNRKNIMLCTDEPVKAKEMLGY